ncbi:MAG: ATP-binding cassette domain-containing protein [Rhodothermales bacterium]|nr:ATP-binding cassette domain-containing protein [Rhodothermales bacterium]
MIEVRKLTKKYGAERAVDDISFNVDQGEVLGFLGPNGAGKSTTMKVITCFLPPSEGTVIVDGEDVRKEGLHVRRKIGYLPENTPLYHDMTTYDYLRFIADMRSIPSSEQSGRLAEMIDVCGLETVLGKRIEALSKGFRQRVGLAQAMIHDPPILILDEPTSGLDPNQIVDIRELIKTVGQRKTVILSTHILSEVQASCDRVLIINEGKLVADGTPDALLATFAGGQRLQFGIHRPSTDVDAKLATIEGIRITDRRSLADGEVVWSLTADGESDYRSVLFALAVSEGWALTELYRDRANLEDVFRQLTTTEEAA